MAKTKHSLVLMVLLVLAACSHARLDPSTWEPGQVLDERSISLGHGYRKVSRSIVNGPGHWEALGHFSYVYFRKIEICQCSPDEVAIEPSGRYVAYADSSTRALMLFDKATRERLVLSADFVGLPRGATWDLADGSVSLTLRRWVGSGQYVDEVRSFAFANQP